MAVVTRERGTFTHPSEAGRRRTRYAAAALSGVIGVLYLVLLFLVADAESGARNLEGNTYGAYLLLAVPYVAGAALLLVYDQQLLWVVGVAVQVAVIVLFVMFGAGAFGPERGVFDYDALSHLPMELWAAVITGGEVVLLGLLVYLAATVPVRHPAAVEG